MDEQFPDYKRIPEDTLEMLRKIKGEVARSLEKAASTKSSFFLDAINWASLRCIRVQWCIDQDGDTEWLVTISEAAPDATALQEFVRSRLADTRPNVDVRTEW